MGGLNRFDRTKELFTRYLPVPTDPYSLFSPVIKTIFQDRQQNLWLGTWQGGGNIQYAARQPFRTYKSDRYASSGLRNEFVRGFKEDEAGHIWIDIDGSSLSRLDPKTKRFTYFPPIATASHYPFTNMLAIEGKVWQATQANPWRHWLDPKNGLLSSCQPGNEELLNQRIEKVLNDGQKNWWLAGQQGAIRFDYQQRCYQTFRHDLTNLRSLTEGRVSTIFEDRQHMIWLGVANGIDRYDSVTHQFFHYPFDRSGSNEYGGANGITQDSKGVIWIISQEDLFRLDSGQRATPTHQISLGQSTLGILTDGHDRLWISTSKGLVCYDPNHSLLNRYGLQSDEFLFRSLLKARNGVVYIGGISGFNAFDPTQIKQNPYRPPVVLTDFRLANRPVPIRNSPADTFSVKSPLTEAITYVGRLALAHDQNDFSFGFRALNYYLPQKNRFRYRLNGYETSWRETYGVLYQH